jgi:hypothetical protein
MNLTSPIEMFVPKTWNQRLFAYESFQEPKTRGSLIFEIFTKMELELIMQSYWFVPMSWMIE